MFISKDKDVFIEKIDKDVLLWENTMLPKLNQFYKECILPEIILQRIQRGKGKCKDPPSIIQAQQALAEKTHKNDIYKVRIHSV